MDARVEEGAITWPWIQFYHLGYLHNHQSGTRWGLQMRRPPRDTREGWREQAIYLRCQVCVSTLTGLCWMPFLCCSQRIGQEEGSAMEAKRLSSHSPGAANGLSLSKGGGGGNAIVPCPGLKEVFGGASNASDQRSWRSRPEAWPMPMPLPDSTRLVVR